MGIIEKLLA